MDSRLIYSATHSLMGKVVWQTFNNQEWIHFGTGKDIKWDLLLELLNSHFKDDPLLMVLERRNSGIVEKAQLLEKITPYLGQANFQLWNKPMKTVMEFHPIGVLRIGGL